MVRVKMIISPAAVKAIVETTMGYLKGMAPGGVPGRLFRDHGCCCLFLVPIIKMIIFCCCHFHCHVEALGGVAQDHEN